MYGMNSVSGAVRGVHDGMDWLEGRQRRAADAQRQAEQDALAEQDRQRQLAEHEQDRARDLQDYEEFDRPRMKDEKDARSEARRLQQTRVKAARALAAASRGDLGPTMALYRDDVPDSYEAMMEWTPDGKVKVWHPKGAFVADSVDDLYFGKADGSGLGLMHMLGIADPAEAVSEKRSRAQKIEDETRSNNQRMREIQAQRAPMAQYGIDAHGNTVLINGTSARQVMGDDGKPLRGAMIGRGGRVASGGGNPFGNSSEMQRLWRGVQMARAADPTGKLVDLPDDAVANMVTEIERSGKARSERMKVAAALVRQVASGMGETMSAQEIQERTTALVDAVDSLAGPEPRMQYGVGVNAMGEPMPSVDETGTGRKVVRRGTAPDGTRVVMYDDGTIEAE